MPTANTTRWTREIRYVTSGGLGWGNDRRPRSGGHAAGAHVVEEATWQPPDNKRAQPRRHPESCRQAWGPEGAHPAASLTEEDVDVLTHFQSFDDDYADFETKIQDLDRRLATIFCQAFDDCNSIESCAKVRGGGRGDPTRGLCGAAPCRCRERQRQTP